LGLCFYYPIIRQFLIALFITRKWIRSSAKLMNHEPAKKKKQLKGLCEVGLCEVE